MENLKTNKKKVVLFIGLGVAIVAALCVFWFANTNENDTNTTDLKPAGVSEVAMANVDQNAPTNVDTNNFSLPVLAADNNFSNQTKEEPMVNQSVYAPENIDTVVPSSEVQNTEKVTQTSSLLENKDLSNFPTTGLVTTQKNMDVTIKIIDRLNEPLIGASALVRGTNNGAVADWDGNVVLKNVVPGSEVDISFIGYVSQKIKINNTNMTVVLEEEDNMLEEVVVVG